MSDLDETGKMAGHMGDALRFAMGGLVPKQPRVVIDDPLLNSIFGGHNTMLPVTNRPFRDLAKMIKKSQDSVKHRNWEFDLAHLDMICVEEMTKTLSRENPLVFVTTGSHMSKAVITNKKEMKDNPEAEEVLKEVKYVNPDDTMIVFIHSSIIRKAELVNILIGDYIKSTSSTHIFMGYCPLHQMGIITALVKEIKAAKWGKNNQHKHIRVIVPKI